MFHGPLQVALVSESTDTDLAVWRLLAPFGYTSPTTGKTVTVPVGFETNFCSVPRIPGAFEFCGDIANQAGTVHDYLYTTCELLRIDADGLLREMILELGYGHARADMMYTAVRAFGSSHYGPTTPVPAPIVQLGGEGVQPAVVIAVTPAA